MHLVAARAREGQDVVDQLAHLAGVLLDDAEQTQPLGVERVRVILDEHRDEPVDGAQGRTQVVRYRVAEALEVVHRRLELVRLALELEGACGTSGCNQFVRYDVDGLIARFGADWLTVQR